MRYLDNTLNRFSLTSWILWGRRNYEFLSANLDGILPSSRTIERQLSTFEETVTEGRLDITRLQTYLSDNELPLEISISEDAIAVVSRAEYCSTRNYILGFSLPLRPNGFTAAEMAVTKSSSDSIYEVTTNSPLKPSVIRLLRQKHCCLKRGLVLLHVPCESLTYGDLKQQ